MTERFGELFDRLPAYLGGHLLLAVPAIVVGVVVSVPLGILAAKRAGVRGPVMTVASLAQTIPSIALLAIMVALLGGVIGFLPAFLALLLYSMLPILRNTVTGLEEVDPAMREAARGLGMTPVQSLVWVEIPLALPVVLAGIRTATVWVVGITTLSTPVGAPSLGNYIFSGLQLRDWDQVYFGCLLAMGLTLVLDQVIHLLEIAARRRRAGLAVAAGGALVVIVGAGLAPMVASALGRGDGGGLAAGKAVPGSAVAAGDAPPPLEGRRFTIGAKGFTEQAILAEWLAGALESAGAETEVLGNLGSTILFDALANDTVDLCIDYSGTLWTTVLKRDRPIGRTALFIEVAHHLHREHGVLVLGRLGFENTYCLAVSGPASRRLGLRRIGDLEPHLAGLTLGGPPEFFGRPEWTRVRDLYGLGTLATRGMDPTFLYRAVRDGQVDVISGFSTDGRIAAFGLRVLEDPRQAFPPYDALVLAGPAASDDPALAATLRPLLNTIDAERMRQANRLVDLEGRSPAEAAESLLPHDPTTDGGRQE